LEAIQYNSMQKEIEIRHCSICKPIDRDEQKYQTDIIATSCVWLENSSGNSSLPEKPEIGKTYTVFLEQPVRFFLHMKLWLFYDCPLASLNGYEKEEEIDQALFCYGQITKIASYDKLGATVEFTVLASHTFQEILQTKPIKELPEFWADFFISSIDRNEYLFETFGKYYKLAVVMAQCDLGQFCIFTKYENELFICMLNEWSFSENFRFGGKYKVPEEIKNLLIVRN
jgi:hypothetical protein